ncbi:MAG: AMP-dependent synthetase, partial [Planctomycetota bacterium]
MSLDTLLGPFRPPTTDLVERLRFWAESTPNLLAYAFLADGEQTEVSWTYAELDARARAIA